LGPSPVVDAGLADRKDAVVPEAVSNVVRHSAPPALAVPVNVDDDLSIDVADNAL
jgi:signal transduction histidine kinase